MWKIIPKIVLNVLIPCNIVNGDFYESKHLAKEKRRKRNLESKTLFHLYGSPLENTAVLYSMQSHIFVM